MVRLAETNSALRQLWRELLEGRKWGRGAGRKKGEEWMSSWENAGKMMGKVWEVVVEASKKWYSKVQPTDIINGIVMYGLVIGFSGNLMGFHRNQWENCGTSWEDLTI